MTLTDSSALSVLISVLNSTTCHESVSTLARSSTSRTLVTRSGPGSNMDMEESESVLGLGDLVAVAVYFSLILGVGISVKSHKAKFFV